MSYQEPPGLPFSVYQMQSQGCLNDNNPPFVPVLNQLPPNVQSSIPAVTGALAVLLTARAKDNPLRMFMFNQLANNNFYNQEFVSLVNGVIEYAILYFMKQAYPNYESAVQDGLQLLTKAWAAVNVVNFPALQSVVPPDMVGGIQETVNWYNNIGAEVQANRYRWTNQGIQPMQPTGMSMSGFGGQQAGGWGQQQGGGWNQGGGMGMGMGGMRSMPGPGRSDVFNNAGGGGQPLMRSVGQVGAGSASTRYDSGGGQAPAGRPWLKGAVAGPQTQQAAPAAAAPAQQSLMNADPVRMQEPIPTQPPLAAPAPAEGPLVPAESNWRLWKPSAVYPFVPAYDPATHTLYFRKNSNGNIEPVLKERNSTVDYDRHSTSAFGNSPAAQRLVKPGQKLPEIDKGNDQLMKALDQGELPSPEGPSEVDVPQPDYLPGELDQQSLEVMIAQGDIARRERKRGDLPEIFRVYGRLAEPLVVSKDVTDKLASYRDAGTFEELKSRLNADVNEVPPNFWVTCNRRATELVNRLLRQNMSIPARKLSIDDFVNDITPLIEALAEDFGKPFQEAFLKNQAKFINGTFLSMDSQEATEWTDQYVNVNAYDDGKVPAMAYPSYDVMLTYINCLAHELGVELAQDVGAAVTSDRLAVLYKVLEGVFADSDNRKADNVNITRHYLILNDGRILEAARGFLYEDVYLLSVIK